MKIPSILTIALYVGAFSTVGGAAWAIGEVTELRPALIKELNVVIAQTQQLAKSVQWIELENLEKQKEHGILSDQENQKRCELAYMLRAFNIKDCAWPAPPPVVQQ